MDAPRPETLHDAVLAWYDDHARELPWRGSGRLGMVGDGQRVHAPADPGRAGAACARRVARSVADPISPGRGVHGGGGADVGPTGLSPSRTTPARGGHGDRRASRRRGPGGVRRPARVAGGGRLHRLRDRQLRLRPTSRRPRHQRQACAGARGVRQGVPGRGRDPRRARGGDVAAARRPRDRRDLGRRDDGLGALVCTARQPRCEACPIADLCSWRDAGSRRTTGHLAAARHGPAPTASAGGGSWRWPARPRARCR